jgi:F-type H+-transporting ATPase subunit a
LFLFILINNLIGLVPYSFASTAHLAVVFSLSFTIVLGATILGILNHGLKFFSIFVPAGTPLALLPLLVMIEFVSYLARHFSLGLRLGANIFSGHLLLTILSGFTYKIMTFGFIYFILALFPLAFIIAFSVLEVAIAFIQAIVFVILTSTYIKDGLELHSSSERSSSFSTSSSQSSSPISKRLSSSSLKRSISTLSNPNAFFSTVNSVQKRFYLIGNSSVFLHRRVISSLISKSITLKRRMSTPSKVVPIKTYSHPDKNKDIIVKENRNKTGVYC